MFQIEVQCHFDIPPPRYSYHQQQSFSGDPYCSWDLDPSFHLWVTQFNRPGVHPLHFNIQPWTSSSSPQDLLVHLSTLQLHSLRLLTPTASHNSSPPLTVVSPTSSNLTSPTFEKTIQTSLQSSVIHLLPESVTSVPGFPTYLPDMC